jgi:hypothetical protein
MAATAADHPGQAPVEIISNQAASIIPRMFIKFTGNIDNRNSD